MSEVRLDRVGIVMMSAIGDAVHVLPVVTAIKRARPDSHISWVLAPGPASLVRGHPCVDEIVQFDKRGGWRALRDLRAELARRPFDAVLALQVYFKAGVVTSLTRAPVKLGFDRARARDLNWLVTTHKIPPHEPQHVQDQYLEFLYYLGVQPAPVEWRLGPRPDEHDAQAWLRDLLERAARPLATLVVGATHPQKEWLPERWAELADTLHESFGLQPVLAGGRSPRELATERTITDRARHAPLSTLGVSLRHLVALIDASALVISLDTGPLHAGVALDRPVIALMGYNNPKRVGPYRRFGDLLVDAYGNPGEDYPISTEHRVDRMPRIHVRDVVEKVEVWRTRYA
ncbi:MAG: glycosyltransferase family 9 protein [Gemmatimonadota bacterium]|nr:glycosyltransferase family 9 protein [Gemmatimonadota bacterium]